MDLVNEKFGCLEVLDNGAEHQYLMQQKMQCIMEEKDDFIQNICNDLLTKFGHTFISDNDDSDYIKLHQHYIYSPFSFKCRFDNVCIDDFNTAINACDDLRHNVYHKCRCLKCGKIVYYPYDTLLLKPPYCYRPMYCSSQHTYSVKASNSRWRKQMKYKYDMSVVLVDNKNLCSPSSDYCDAWNKMRDKQLIKAEMKKQEYLDSLPVRFVDNYNKDFVGLCYESIFVISCEDEKYERIPVFYDKHWPVDNDFNQYKKRREIVFSKLYRCRCYLCGKEQLVESDAFGIYPPTQYGRNAYHGYWSKLKCDCHYISSFQWIVNDILLSHNIVYQVEVTFSGLFGVDGQTPLSFDFAVYKNGGLYCLIECQGEQHYKPVLEFGGEYSFAKQQRNDNMKRQWCIHNSVFLLEISYKDKKYDTVLSILFDAGVI